MIIQCSKCEKLIDTDYDTDFDLINDKIVCINCQEENDETNRTKRYITN